MWKVRRRSIIPPGPGDSQGNPVLGPISGENVRPGPDSTVRSGRGKGGKQAGPAFFDAPTLAELGRREPILMPFEAKMGRRPAFSVLLGTVFVHKARVASRFSSFL